MTQQNRHVNPFGSGAMVTELAKVLETADPQVLQHIAEISGMGVPVSDDMPGLAKYFKKKQPEAPVLMYLSLRFMPSFPQAAKALKLRSDDIGRVFQKINEKYIIPAVGYAPIEWYADQSTFIHISDFDPQVVAYWTPTRPSEHVDFANLEEIARLCQLDADIIGPNGLYLYWNKEKVVIPSLIEMVKRGKIVVMTLACRTIWNADQSRQFLDNYDVPLPEFEGWVADLAQVEEATGCRVLIMGIAEWFAMFMPEFSAELRAKQMPNYHHTLASAEDKGKYPEFASYYDIVNQVYKVAVLMPKEFFS